MPVEYIEKSFTYKIPDEWRGTTFDQGKTGTFTYKGPRFLTLEISLETGRETGWCLWEDRDLERPCGLDKTRITVDCSLNDENALLCEIANDCGDPEQVKFRTERSWSIQWEAPEGYTHLWQPDEVEPRDIYDEFNIVYDFETGKFTLPLKTFAAEGMTTDLSWDDVRMVRNKMLAGADGKISEDMPQHMKDAWMEYRQKLRDLPTVLAHLPPWVAGHMFPEEPKFDQPIGAQMPMYTGGKN